MSEIIKGIEKLLFVLSFMVGLMIIIFGIIKYFEIMGLSWNGVIGLICSFFMGAWLLIGWSSWVTRKKKQLKRVKKDEKEN